MPPTERHFSTASLKNSPPGGRMRARKRRRMEKRRKEALGKEEALGTRHLALGSEEGKEKEEEADAALPCKARTVARKAVARKRSSAAMRTNMGRRRTR
jgi:hypothetical protein